MLCHRFINEGELVSVIKSNAVTVNNYILTLWNSEAIIVPHRII